MPRGIHRQGRSPIGKKPSRSNTWKCQINDDCRGDYVCRRGKCLPPTNNEPNSLHCNDCDTVYDYDTFDITCCDAMFYDSNYWLDPNDPNSPRLTCSLIAMFMPNVDCSGCTCPCDPPGSGFGC